MAEETRPRLGRGLAALIGDSAENPPTAELSRAQRRVPIEFLKANPRNPRKTFNDEDLADLVESVRQRGVIQPIVVRPTPKMPDRFEIIAGERRWRAAQKANIHEVPIVVIEANDKEALEIAIVENVQRSDLNPLEEAQGYAQLIQEFSYAQNDLAKIIGKSRSHIANTLRLLQLPDQIKTMLSVGDLSAGHARALLTLPDPAAAAHRIVSEGLSVRDVERMGQNPTDADRVGRRAQKTVAKDADTVALERSLSDRLGLSITITPNGEETGEVRIRYKNFDQLDELCSRLRG